MGVRLEQCMPWEPTLWFSEFRVFWRLRVLLRRVAFLLARRIWTTSAAEQAYGDEARLFAQFVRLTLGQLSLAVVATLMLQTVELALVPHIESLHGGWEPPEPQVYTPWLLAVAQIGGVFLALYFTALTAAAAAIYSQVPEHIRNLLAEEPVGNVYIKLLTFTTFTPLCLVALTAFGLLPLRTAVPALVLLSGVGIMAFAKLGHRAFDLFSVIRLSRSAFANFWRALARAQATSFRWNDPPFQNHAHKQGAAALRDLVTFAEICAKTETLKGKPLLDLTVESLRALNYYQQQKTSIPTKSLWYQQQLRQKEWYLTPDWALSVAQQMGMPLSPEQAANHWWVEEEVEGMCLTSLRTFIKDSRLDLTAQVINATHSYATTLATNGDLGRVLKFCSAMISACRAFRARLSATDGPPADQVNRVAIAERLAALLTSTVVAFTNGLPTRSTESSRMRLAKTNIRRHGSVYTQGFTVPQLEELECGIHRLSFERAAEGHEVTPAWYLRSMLAHVNVVTISSGATEIISSAADTFTQLEDLFRNNQWAVAAVLSTELEFWSRLLNHNVGVIVSSYADQGTARVLTDSNWPVMEEQPLRERASKSRFDVITRAATLLATLFATERPDGVPDYRGQFSDTIAQTVFDAIIDNNSDIVARLFPRLFTASLFLFEQLKPTEISSDIWAEQKLQIAAAPILDISELSGYAQLVSEIHRNPAIWVPVQQTWESFFKSSPTALRWLAAIIGYGEPQFALPHRSTIRTTWQMRVRDLFAGIARQTFDRLGPRLSGVEVNHESPLVRVCARNSFADGLDIFVDAFLRNNPGAKELDWGRRAHTRLDQQLRREAARDRVPGEITNDEET